MNCAAELLTGLAAAGLRTSVAHLELMQSDGAVEVAISTASVRQPENYAEVANVQEAENTPRKMDVCCHNRSIAIRLAAPLLFPLELVLSCSGVSEFHRNLARQPHLII